MVQSPLAITKLGMLRDHSQLHRANLKCETCTHDARYDTKVGSSIGSGSQHPSAARIVWYGVVCMLCSPLVITVCTSYPRWQLNKQILCVSLHGMAASTSWQLTTRRAIQGRRALLCFSPKRHRSEAYPQAALQNRPPMCILMSQPALNRRNTSA